MERISAILNEATAAISQASDDYSLAQARSKYLGKNSSLTAVLKSLPTLDPSLRAEVGKMVNQAKNDIEQLLLARMHALQEEKLAKSLNATAIDVSLPSRGQEYGSTHPVTQVKLEVEDFFASLGFKIVGGPEIEDDYHNFTALNIPASHPARAEHDTFYFADGTLLRTHTSPTQIRAMLAFGAPLRVITAGRVYRRDSDATHTPMFHQLEGFMIDEGISFANLKWVLQSFLAYFFGSDVKSRMRPSYFPFTEPSAEIDIQRTMPKGNKEESNEDNCKEKWLEVLGCGMIHPNVLEAGGIDSKKYSGFAFGLGLDRFAMLRYGINDLRLMFENDLEFLRQF